MDDPEARIAAFTAKYAPAIEAQLKDARARLRLSFPRGFELVFDNYNALVFAISPTPRAPDAFVSVAGYPKWVTLFFRDGAALHDPSGLLEGDGKQFRSIRLADAAQVDDAGVRALIAQAASSQRDALALAPALETIVKTVAEKQRSRRPAPEARRKT